MAKHRVVDIPFSRLKQSITEILYDQGYIHRYKVEKDEGPQGRIRIALKYDKMTGTPVIRKLGRFSRPGLRQYAKAKDIPRVMNGLGVAIVSTSRGIMTGKKARSENVGGEVLCYVY